MNKSSLPAEPALEASYLRRWLGLSLTLLVLCFLLNMVMGLPRAGLPRVLADWIGAPRDFTTFADLFFFGLGKCLTDLLAGWMTDASRGGRKTVLLVGAALTALGCLCIGLAIPGGVPVTQLDELARTPRSPATTQWAPFFWISAGMFLTGLGSGFQNQGIMTAMQDLGGTKRRGLAGGLMEAALYYGVTAGTFLGGWAVEQTGQVLVPFLFMAGIAAICLVVGALYTRDTRGLILESAGFARRRPGFDAYRAAMSHPSLYVIYLAGLMSKWVDSMIFGVTTLYLQGLGYSVADCATILAGFVLSWSTISLFSGALSDYVGRKTLVWAGMLWNAVFTLVFLHASRPGDLGWELLLTVLLGCGTGLYYGLPPAIAADLAAVEWRGVAISVYRFWRDLGHIVAALVFIAVYRAYGQTQLAEERIMQVSAGLLVCAAVVAFVFMKETFPARGDQS